MTLDELNQLPEEQAAELLFQCNTSLRWVEQMTALRPFESAVQLLESSVQIWQALDMPDHLQAFEGHPKIGDIQSLKQKFAATKDWASGEQSGMSQADERLIERLAQANNEYQDRFGFIFIICATGKSADEMLDALEARMINPLPIELGVAAKEQEKITQLRLQKLIEQSPDACHRQT